MLKVTHISTWDNAGGAARAAFRLHEGLKRAGHESRMVVGWKVESAAEIDAVMMGGKLRKKVVRRVASMLDKGLSLQYSLLPWSHDFLNHPFIRDADIIHLHNLHAGYFPYRVLPKLGRIAPVIWSLHDMWAMTGHCAYSYECERWRTGCGRCPILDEPPAIYMDTTAVHWRIKDYTYRKSRMTIVTGSVWMAQIAKQSPLLNRFDIHTIPYGTDLSVFRPIDKLQARHLLRIPQDARVILVFVVNLRRKGVSYFLQALEKLAVEPRPWLLVVGERLSGTPAGFPVREVGYIQSDDLLNMCYGASDIFVLPTLADNFPLSVLDAFAVGTPAVAFDVGGVSELVRHRETGYLVRSRNSDELSEALRLLLTDGETRGRLGENARRMVETEYSCEMYTRRYLSLYEDAIKSDQRDRMDRGLVRS